jgi:endonuclease/exonuclease/phosphatase family metal-dependent hydrolase
VDARPHVVASSGAAQLDAKELMSYADHFPQEAWTVHSADGGEEGRAQVVPIEPVRDVVIRVATLNVWGRFARWPLRRQILVRRWAAVEADLLLLQEVCADADGDQAEEIATSLRYPHVVWTEGHQVLGGSEGLAILSRLPLADVRVDELPLSEPPRRMLSASLDGLGRSVRVVCAHTVAVPEDARLRQVAAVLACPDDPVIIGGDLNGPPGEILPLTASAGLADGLAGAVTPTWPVCDVTFGDSWASEFGRAPHFSLDPRRLDYLLTRGLRVLRAGVDVLGDDEKGYASDHAVVWGDVELHAEPTVA